MWMLNISIQKDYLFSLLGVYDSQVRGNGSFRVQDSAFKIMIVRTFLSAPTISTLAPNARKLPASEEKDSRDVITSPFVATSPPTNPKIGSQQFFHLTSRFY